MSASEKEEGTMAFEKLKENLEANGFAVSVFATGEEAAAYLNR